MLEASDPDLDKALLVGHLSVTFPTLLIFLAVATWLQAGFVGVSLAAGASLAWWSVLVPRWRNWALRGGMDPTKLQRAAFRTGLVWPRGHFMGRTEVYLSDRAFYALVAALLLGVFLAVETVISEYVEQRLTLPGITGPLLAAGVSALLVLPVQRGLSRLVRRFVEESGQLQERDGGTV